MWKLEQVLQSKRYYEIHLSQFVILNLQLQHFSISTAQEFKLVPLDPYSCGRVGLKQNEPVSSVQLLPGGWL